MTTIILAERLTKRYGVRRGVENVALAVEAGQVFGFLGPNGAGKTTTIRLLLGLVRPTAGSARIFGLDCWADSHRVKREIGYLPGDLRLYPWMTTSRALSVFGRIRGRDLRPAGRVLAERFSLEWDLPVRKMSRGTRQKLGLVLAMAHGPQLLILDEPTSGLDPLIQDELGQALRELAQRGHTVFFSSHTLSEVETLCDRVAIVREGQIVADESIADMRYRATKSITLYFADTEAANTAVPPEFLRLLVREPTRWLCELTGPSPLLVKWAAHQRIEDLEISQPDLNSLFRSYYRPLETAE